MKKVFQWILAICAMLFFLTGTEALAATPSLMDEAGLLQKAEKKEVSDALKAVEQAHHVRIAVVTVKSTGGAEAGKFANQLLDKAYTDGAEGNMVLLLAMDTRDWYISTDNKMRVKITDDNGITALSEAFLPALKEGKYGNAFKTYATKSDELISYYEKEGEAYDPNSGFQVLPFGIAFILAVCGGMGYRNYLISKMSNVMPAPGASEYLEKGSFALSHEDDMFLFMNVVRKPKPKKSERTSSADSSHGGGGGKF